jgi:hypothetical protein
MKTSFLFAAAAALLLSGCAIFQRSPTWARVVDSRADYEGPADAGGKEGYINHLHQVLSNAGVEHKVVTFLFRYHSVSREESVETATAVIYRDETTPRNPWWVMDEYHHVPTWLPNGELDTQLGFFMKRKVEIIEVKEYGARTSDFRASAPRQFAQGRKPSRVGITQSASPRSAAPRHAVARTSGSASAEDSRNQALFRSTHGTAFDPGSSVDRAKMAALRRQLLSRNHHVGLRSE